MQALNHPPASTGASSSAPGSSGKEHPATLAGPFLGADGEGDKILIEFRADLEGMKKKESAMEAKLQEIRTSNQAIYAAIAAYERRTTPAEAAEGKDQKNA